MNVRIQLFEKSRTDGAIFVPINPVRGFNIATAITISHLFVRGKQKRGEL